MAKTIKENVDIDAKKNVIAKCHDESHLNRYLVNHVPGKILSPAYCYSEYTRNRPYMLNIKPVILSLEKDAIPLRSSKKFSILKKIDWKIERARKYDNGFWKFLVLLKDFINSIKKNIEKMGRVKKRS
jgi:hypothetical protein